MTRTVEFVVTGDDKLHCASCEQRVERALRRLRGVQDVKASVDTQHIVATIDDAQVHPDQVRTTLEDLGYEVDAQGGAG